MSVCAYCEKTFTPKNKSHKYCCAYCKGRYNYEIKKKRKEKKPKKEKKPCVICGNEFTPRNKRQVTCGTKKCTQRYSQEKWKKKLETTTVPPPPLYHKTWESYTPEERWERMSLSEISAEITRLRLKSYGKARILKGQGNLPEEFGLELMRNDKKRT